MLELTFWTAGVNFSINLDLVLGLISVFILVLTFKPVFGINFAGVIFLILNDAQGALSHLGAAAELPHRRATPCLEEDAH